MRLVLKILAGALFLFGLFVVVSVTLVLYWSYGQEKRVPPQAVSKIEKVLERLSPNTKVFIGRADVEFHSFSDGLGMNLKNSYIQIGDNINASVPQIKIKLKVSDLFLGQLKFRDIELQEPKFVITGNVGAEDFSESASKDFFDLYKKAVYSLFDKINKSNSAIPVDKIDLTDAVFSFNKQGKYETWKIDSADLSFYSLQNTTYLSTNVKTELFNKASQITINARLLEADRMMLKIDYKNLSSLAFSKFVKGIEWFDELQPVLSGTSNVVMDKEGGATTISLDTDINYEKPEVAGTTVGFKGVMDLVQDESDTIKPKVNGSIFLKDVDMVKLPILWPEKYGTKVRADVLKNYTKGTYNNVEVDFDYGFEDTEFSRVSSEKFSISGDLVNTDVIYSPDFPAIEKVDGRFSYDGNDIDIEMHKGNLGKLDFGDTKVSIKGLNDAKTILEMDGTANGDLMALRPLLKSILKGRDENFFYNTHDIKANSDIKFYYKDNINIGFDPDVVKMNIDAALSAVTIKDVVKDVDLTTDKLNLKIDNEGLHVEGEADLNKSPSQVKVFVGFIKQNDIAINATSEAQTDVLDKLLPGVNKYANGVIELEFQYNSDATSNYFAGKIDTMDADVNFPYFAWSKPKGTFATATFGGSYISGQAINVKDLQIVTGDSVSSGNFTVSLDDSVADEVNFTSLNLGSNNAEVHFSRAKTGKDQNSYAIKISGRSFNAEKLIDSFQKIASDNNAMVFDMDVEDLFMANSMKLHNVKAALRCGNASCNTGNFNADIEGGGKISAIYKPQDGKKPDGIKSFQITSDNAGNMIRSFGFSNNIDGGVLGIGATVGETGKGESNGTITIDDFTITRAPILTKLFSLASFTGILDVLTGSGVPMKKLRGNFQLKDDYLVISDLRSFGNSLGFTMQGTIQLDESTVDLSGAVTPSYSVNSMFGKIPLLGEVFKGKEGEGLIATNYTIRGNYPDVEISVNPLSALTPGFLRNIWGDAETDVDKKKAQDKKKTNIKQKGFPANVRPATENK